MAAEKKGITACIIDDDSIYVFAFKRIMKAKNLCSNLLDFGNGKEAIDYLTNPENIDKLPDVIFLDINMPVMDGWNFISLYGEFKHRLSKNITIYMVSSSISHDDINRAKEIVHISDYFIKPVSTDQLIEVLSKAA